MGKFKKKQGEVLKKVKDQTATAAKRVTGTLPDRERDEDTSWKRDILEGRKYRHRSHDHASKVNETDGQPSGKADEGAVQSSQEAQLSEEHDQKASSGAKDQEEGASDRPAG